MTRYGSAKEYVPTPEDLELQGAPPVIGVPIGPQASTNGHAPKVTIPAIHASHPPSAIMEQWFKLMTSLAESQRLVSELCQLMSNAFTPSPISPEVREAVKKPPTAPPNPSPDLNAPIAVLGLPPAAELAYETAEIVTIADLLAVPDFIQIKGIGKPRADATKIALERYLAANSSARAL